jgi:mono/diheme cytochrome c family protein
MSMSPRSKRFRAVAIFMVVAGFMAIQAMQSPIRAVLGAATGRTNSSAQVAPSTANPASAAGAESYAKRCAICHGEQREGILPAFPPLAGIKRQMTDQQITVLIHDGKGRMPGFQKISNEELSALLEYLATPPAKTALPANTTRANRKGFELSGEAAAGDALFQQNCSFCHGRDAMGGETGPDLTQSKLVLTDTDGSKISEVVTQGRPNSEKKMPAFQFLKPELSSLVAFIRAREAAAAAMEGGRRGVTVADLQTGNVEAGRTYFNGAGGCAKCHSPTGDLAGIARRHEGLQLEERMLYPRDAKSTVTVVLPSGQKVMGTLAYLDEFTVGLRDGNGVYKSWPIESVKYTVDSPVNAHVEQFSKYTDDDIHNLMAYLQTLR